MLAPAFKRHGRSVPGPIITNYKLTLNIKATRHCYAYVWLRFERLTGILICIIRRYSKTVHKNGPVKLPITEPEVCRIVFDNSNFVSLFSISLIDLTRCKVTWSIRSMGITNVFEQGKKSSILLACRNSLVFSQKNPSVAARPVSPPPSQQYTPHNIPLFISSGPILLMRSQS